MFTDSKYTKWYFSIIEGAINRTNIGYTELHHIIPKCLGGSDTVDNLIELTAREHFICHWLLSKMVTETKQKYQLWNAFSCMLYRERPGQERYKVSSKVFESIKIAGSKIKSERFKGENNPMFGKRGILSPNFGKKWTEEHRRNASISHLGQTRTIESRKKQSEKTKGRKQTIEHISKRARSGEQNHMYGKKLSPETIAKRTATLKANKLAKKLAAGV
jgi:hypothetical protein